MAWPTLLVTGTGPIHKDSVFLLALPSCSRNTHTHSPCRKGALAYLVALILATSDACIFPNIDDMVVSRLSGYFAFRNAFALWSLLQFALSFPVGLMFRSLIFGSFKLA